MAVKHWNPVTGYYVSFSSSPDLVGFVYQHIILPAGQLVLLDTGCGPAKGAWRLAWLPPGGSDKVSFVLDTNVEINAYKQDLLPLGEDAAVLVTQDVKETSIKAYVIRREATGLTMEAMPAQDLPTHRNYVAAMAGKQLMILGGSQGTDKACKECSAETHVLDLQAKAWRQGPPMLEARSQMAASTLPDGSILVTGGWTRDADQVRGPSRTVERWNPENNRFEAMAPMPAGNAKHRHLWWNAPWGKTLLVGVGVSGSLDAFDQANGIWRTLASWPASSEGGDCGLLPFTVQNIAYAWLWRRGEEKYCKQESEFFTFSTLQVPESSPLQPRLSTDLTRTTYRKGAAFIPAKGMEPALLIGGAQNIGNAREQPSGALDAITLDGRIMAMPALHFGRQNARALRIGAGILVFGGDNPEGRALPAEWAPDAASPHWQQVDGIGLDSKSVFTQLKDGTILTVGERGLMQQLKLKPKGGQLLIERRTWPSLTQERSGNGLRVREVRDGRIVLAGGMAATNAGTAYQPVRTYEIFDPAKRRWTTSAPANAAGGNALVLQEGRVIQWGRLSVGAQLTWEISNSAGTGWMPLQRKGSRLAEDETLKLYEQDGELFAFGTVSAPGAKKDAVGLEWFSASKNQWEPLWEGTPRDTWGSTIIRKLVEQNGDEKTLVISLENG